MALLQSGGPFGRAPPEFSYIPISQCKLKAVCCRERLHVTVSGKNADLSLGRASNCTTIPHFESVSKYSCMERFLVLSGGVEFPPTLLPSSIGFTVAKNTACLPLLRLFPPGISPFLIVEFNSFAFPT